MDNRDLTGRIFGELTVVRKLPYKKPNNHHTLYECQCSCGAKIELTSGGLLNCKSQSCGHLRREIAAEKLKAVKSSNAAGYLTGTMCARLTSTTPNKGNTSGYKGVSFNKTANAYTAQIYFRRKKYYLGLFKDPAEAYKAYLEAKDKLHKQFLDEVGYNNPKEP